MPDPSYGAQAAWAINPGTGSDSNAGTPASPLRTMAEFSARMQDQFVSVAQTLQLVGDVIDSPLWLSATRYALGAQLAVTGTRTDLGTGTITIVTGLGAAGTQPWQLTTTGIDWTTVPVGAQCRFSTGQLAMVLEVIDATNVVVGAIGALTGSVTVAPTVASTVTAATLSRALPPILNCSAHLTASTPAVLLQSLSFDVGQHSLRGGAFVQFYGCELKFNSTTLVFEADSDVSLRCSRITVSASQGVLRAGCGTFDTTGLVVAGTGAVFLTHQRGRVVHSSTAITGCRLLINGCQGQAYMGQTYIQRTAGPVLINNQGQMVCNGIINGALGNTGIGIDVPMGRVSYASTTKPTVTGSTPGVNDTRIGGVTLAYAAIPNVAANTAAMVQE